MDLSDTNNINNNQFLVKYNDNKIKYLDLWQMHCQGQWQIGSGKYQNHIIHISGFPGSGKSTLGDKLQSMFGKKVAVYDTDNFIQHHTKEGKQLLAIEKSILAKDSTKTPKDYKVLWRRTIKNKIDEFVSNNKNKIIIFVGSLDNFSWKGEIYDIHAEHKILLDIKLDELMKRYYLRLSKRDAKGNTNSYNSSNYWKNVSKGVYNIDGSEQIIKDSAKYNEWHRKHNYEFMNENEIIGYVKKIIDLQDS